MQGLMMTLNSSHGHESEEIIQYKPLFFFLNDPESDFHPGIRLSFILNDIVYMCACSDNF